MSATSEKVLQCHFNGSESEQERTVEATLIEKAARNGQPIELRHAIIRGPLRLNSVALKKDVCFLKCHFEESVQFSHSFFESTLILSGSTFLRGCDLHRATVAGDCRLKNAKFFGSISRFDEAQVLGVFSADRTRFAGTAVKFCRAQFAKSASFRRCTFKKEADFTGAKFSSHADFSSTSFFGDANFLTARFSGQAIFEAVSFKQKAIFNGVKIEEAAFFRSTTGDNPGVITFEGDVDFIAADFGGTAEFEGAQFKQKAMFARAHFGGSAFFYSLGGKSPVVAIFEGDADFSDTDIGKDVNFSGALFQRKASFNSTHIGGNAFFSSHSVEILDRKPIVTKFIGAADFTAVRIGGSANFDGAVFEQKAIFNSAHIDAHASFSLTAGEDPLATTFMGDVDFASIQIGGGAANFKRAKFTNPEARIVFSRASFVGDGQFSGASFAGEAFFDGLKIGAAVDFQAATLWKGVTFRDANISGTALFSSLGTTESLTTDFKGGADFSGAVFGSDVSFDGVRFSSIEGVARFDRVRIRGIASFRKALFESGVSFIGAQITGQAIFPGAKFNSGDKPVSFFAAKLDGGLFFGARPELQLDAATFAGAASFIGLCVKGETEFIGVKFSGDDKTIDFTGARFEGTGRFGVAGIAAATFVGPVIFNAVQFGGEARFVNVEFNRSASFFSANMNSLAVFHFAKFRKGSKPMFAGTQFRQQAAFHLVRFDDEVDFSGAVFAGEASFAASIFNDSAKFIGCRFIGVAHFDRGLSVKGESLLGAERNEGALFHDVSFDHARFDQDAHFEETLFKAKASFRETSFRVLSFSGTGRVADQIQFQGRLDLSGCTYDRIQVDWKSLFRMKDGSARLEDGTSLYHHLEEVLMAEPTDNSRGETKLERSSHDYLRYIRLERALYYVVQEYDRQPYNQLESVFRATGRDRDANKVYLTRRRAERNRYWRRAKVFKLRWAFDAFYWLLAGYGIRPARLLVYSAALILLGTVVFKEPRAAKLKTEPKISAEVPRSPGSEPVGRTTTAVPEQATEPKKPDWTKGLAISVHQFLPVDVAWGSEWQLQPVPVFYYGRLPVRPDVCATILKIAGFIIVPVIIATLAGLLRRVAR
ncbi:MAG: pentapeptide repeat-containing protein [Verrucomicrobiota bacterium]|nr:pentapeptide repeat-containing protein [Verrucomicrobiota bacterium]